MHCAKFQAPTAVQMRSLLFWVVRQRMSAVVYQCCRTAYQSHLQGSSSPRR